MKKNGKQSNSLYSQQLLKQINASNATPLVNKRIADDFYEYLKASKKERTITLYMYALQKYFSALGNKRYDKATKNDLNKAVNSIKAYRSDKSKLPLGERTIADILGNIKMFYKWALGKNKHYPEIVDDINTREPKKVILPTDILTEDEVLRMLNACNTLRDRAVVAMLYDTGARIGELMAIKLCDISFDSSPIRVTLDGKTGARSVPIVLSVPYLQQYLAELKDLQANDIIWRTTTGYSHNGGTVDYDAFWNIFATAGKKAKITKRVNPHSFRHARATYLARYMTEQQLKKIWAGQLVLRWQASMCTWIRKT